MGIDAQMFVRIQRDVTDAEVKRLAWEAGSAFGPDRFWIFKNPDYQRPAMHKIAVYEQDGPDIVPGPGETFVKVQPATRYYGEGYERGDLPFLIMLAEWLEARVPDCEVWYGGDSSGVLAEKFDRQARDKLWQHFVNVNHQPYVGGFAMRGGMAPLCSWCDEPMAECGWNQRGPGSSLHRCTGCGESVVRLKDGTVEPWNEKQTA